MNQEKSDYIKNWLYHAREDLAVMKDLIDSNHKQFTSTICFHAQQAVEKYLKAFLIFHDVDFPRTTDYTFGIILQFLIFPSKSSIFADYIFHPVE